MSPAQVLQSPRHSQSTRHSRSTRGAAAVEMAVTMVVLVPLIFFALFLEDFVYYRLEGQEPVVAAVSDVITPNWMRSRGDITLMNRLKYCDHTAAYDSYERNFECDGESGGAGGPGGPSGGSSGLGHHHATGAHQCWLGAGQQVTCTFRRSDTALNTGTAMTTFQSSNWNRGGIMTCVDRLNVYNWIIPKNISQGGGWLWSDRALTDRTQYGKAGGGDNAGSREWNGDYSFDDAHTDGRAAGNSSGSGTSDLGGSDSDETPPPDPGGDDDMGSWPMKGERLAALADPWALTDIGITGPDTGGINPIAPGSIPGTDTAAPLTARTGNYYNQYARTAATSGMNWRQALEGPGYLSTTSGTDTAGDNLNTVPVTWRPDRTRGGNGGFGSGYRDSRQRSFSRGDEYPSDWSPP